MISFLKLRAQVGHLAAACAAGIAVLVIGALLAVFTVAPSDAAIEQHRALLIASQAKGDFSEAGLRALLAQTGPGAVAVGARFDPALFRPSPSITSSAPLDRSMLAVLPGLNAQQAQAVNAGFAPSDEPNPPARPFRINGAAAQDRERALGCLTQAVYYEAGFEPLEGAQAVAQVVLNRVRHPAFPKTVCGVVYEGAAMSTGCQFSFTCDGSLGRPPAPAAWKRAQDVATHALNGYVMAKVGNATHYHTEWVVPYWAPTLAKVGLIGSQIFYRWPGDWGLPAAFRARYAGGENPGVDVGGDPLATAGSPIRVRAHMTLAAAGPVVVAAVDPAPIEAVAAPVAGSVADVPPAPIQVAPQRPETPGRVTLPNLR
jgi:hypothetical protein